MINKTKCPECNKSWKKTIKGKKAVALYGVYDADKRAIIKWRCPFCDKEWSVDEQK